jgi:hypothetical protein
MSVSCRVALLCFTFGFYSTLEDEREDFMLAEYAIYVMRCLSLIIAIYTIILPAT